MFCPKCLGETPDSENRCVKCGHILFLRKPASLLGRFQAVPKARTTFGDWVIWGPIVFSEHGLHFFVKTCHNTRAEKAGGIAENIAVALGMGYLFGGAVGEAAATLFSEDAPRPKEFLFRKTELVISELIPAAQKAPEIHSSPVFFTVERKTVNQIAFSLFGGISVRLPELTLSLSEVDSAGEVQDFVAGLGYPTT